MDPDFIKIQRGDRTAFRQFFNEFYPALCFFANKILHDQDSANDIVQDAFITIWGKKKDIGSLNAAKSYLFKIVKNRSLNYLRDTISKSDFKPEEIASYYTYNDFIIETETYRLIYEAIQILSQQERRVIEFTLDGLKNHEIAQQLGVSLNTVKTLKSRAFKTLRNQLNGVSFQFFIFSHSFFLKHSL